MSCLLPCWALHHRFMCMLQALGELSGKALGCLLVVRPDGKLMGTFTDGDLRRTLQSRGAQVPCPALPAGIAILCPTRCKAALPDIQDWFCNHTEEKPGVRGSVH